MLRLNPKLSLYSSPHSIDLECSILANKISEKMREIAQQKLLHMNLYLIKIQAQKHDNDNNITEF